MGSVPVTGLDFRMRQWTQSLQTPRFLRLFVTWQSVSLPCYLINASILWLGVLKLPSHRWGHWGLEKPSVTHSELVRAIQTWVVAPQSPSQRAPVCWWRHTFGRVLDVHGTCWVSVINYPEVISELVWWWGPMIPLKDLIYINRSQSLPVTRWPRGDHGMHPWKLLKEMFGLL